MAGVIPQLARRGAASGPDWQCVVVRPGADPDAALARALERIDPSLEYALAEEVAAWAAEKRVGLAFVLDQLEEVVTQAPANKRQRFLAFLADAARFEPARPIRI